MRMWQCSSNKCTKHTWMPYYLGNSNKMPSYIKSSLPWCTFYCVPAAVQWHLTEKVCLFFVEPTPNTCTAAVDGNAHKCAFYFAGLFFKKAVVHVFVFMASAHNKPDSVRLSCSFKWRQKTVLKKSHWNSYLERNIPSRPKRDHGCDNLLHSGRESPGWTLLRCGCWCRSLGGQFAAAPRGRCQEAGTSDLCAGSLGRIASVRRAEGRQKLRDEQIWKREVI